MRGMVVGEGGRSSGVLLYLNPAIHTFKESSWLLLVECEQFSGGLSDLGEGELDAPHLTLVTQTILADNLQLLVEAFLLEGTARSRVRLTTHERNARHLGGYSLPSTEEIHCESTVSVQEPRG